MIEGFIPEDQHRALSAKQPLSVVRNGTAVFCDIVGFSTVSADLVRAHGRRQGAELLHRMLEQTIGQVVSRARKRQGFALSFAGDSVTLWFDAIAIGSAAQSAAQAGASALDLAAGWVPGSPRLRLSIASGAFGRLTLGDPAFGWLELLGGEPSLRLAEMDQLAGAERIVICQTTAGLIAGYDARLAVVPGQDAFVLEGLKSPPLSVPADLPALDAETALAWVPLRLRDMVLALEKTSRDLAALAEIRPITAVFVLIADASSAGNAVGWARCEGFLRDLQASVHRSGGMVLDLSADAKGTYAPCVFGAPEAHEDDPERALAAALAALELGARHGVVLKVGVARGTGLAGLIAADSRLRYSTISAAMNRAARLMMRAKNGTALTTTDMAERVLARFDFAEAGYGSTGTAGADIRGWRVTGKKQGKLGPLGAFGERVNLLERDSVLAAAQQAVQSDGAAFVVLESAPGYGKSAILGHLRQFAESGGRLWLHGRGENQSRDIAFHAWFPILGDVLERSAEVDAASEDVAVLAWVAGQSATVPDSLAGLSGAERAVKIGAAMVAVLALLNALQPVTIVFDDLQWADTRSLGLLLAVRGSALPVRIVVARRRGPPASMEAAMLFGSPGVQVLGLDRLSADGVIALAARALGARTLSYDLGRLFQDSAAGSPLVVKLISDVLSSRKLVRIQDGHCIVVADAEQLGRLDFLESEEAAIIARFDEMPEAQKQAVRTASILGRAFTYRELGAALADPSEVQATVNALLQSGYLVAQIDRTGAGLQFVQPLVQQAISQSISFARRAPVNRRLAEFWATSSEPGAMLHRARHLLSATDADERDPGPLGITISALEAAANQSAAASANLEASDLLDAAIGLSKRLPDGADTQRLRLTLQAGLAFELATFRGYGDPSVEGAYSAALALANESENSADLAFTIYGMFSFYASRGDYAKAMPIARRLHRLAVHFSDLRLASIAHQSRGIIAILRGRIAAGATLAARSIEDADHFGHGLFFPHGGAGDFRIFSGAWLALALAVAGRWPDAETAYQRAFVLSETNAFGRGFLKSFCPLPVLAGRHAEALAYADEIVADADARGLALFSVIGGIYSGWAAASLGQDDARVAGFLNAKIHIAQAMGLGSFTPWFLVLAAEAHLSRGEIEPAARAVETAEAMITQSGGGLFVADVARCRARITFARGDAATAKRILDSALALARSQGLYLFASGAADLADALARDPAAVTAAAQIQQPRHDESARGSRGKVEPVTSA